MRSLTVKSIIVILFLVSSVASATDDTPRSFFTIPAHSIITSQRAYNPVLGIAPIAFNQNRVGISYSNRYLLKETNTFLGFGSYNLKFVSLGFSADYFGNQAFWNSTQRFILAKKLTEKISLGVSFSHTLINQGAQYSTIHQYAPSVAISLKPLETWQFSSALRNISHQKNTAYGFNDFVIAGTYSIKNLSLHIQLEKMQQAKTKIDVMGEYDLKKKLCFMLRTSTGNEPLSLGIDCKFLGISLFFLFSYHAQLGSSPELSMYKSW